ncbi:relaxase/mobilization nuclease domain-containing protein [Actinomadura kijaniata]|uniref:relaxase/mobilization nuclease domain-containing protein n=1 Tax=Actinomadura kijaniata TaxID=46161 RepID=UPI003F1E36D4
MNNFIAARGSDPTGLVLYLFGPGRFNEHVDQRVIAAAETLGIADGTRLDFEADHDEILMLGAELDSHRKALGVQMPGGQVWHCALSLPPGETLTDAQWAQAVRYAVQEMGFDESSGKAPCRWLAVHHGASARGNDHVHLVVNLVREDGTFASLGFERRKMSRVCAELERRFGLSVVEGRAGAGMPGLSRAEIEDAARTGAPEPDRIKAARIVRGCAVAASSEADFVRRLRAARVAVRPRFAKGGRHQVVGYSVALRGSSGQVSSLWWGGGKLAPDLTLTRLREHWRSTPQAMAEAVAEWGSGRMSTAQTPRHRAEAWEQAALVVAQIRKDLAAVAHEDVAVWAGVAREAAGVLAAWSARVETRRPGPLAYAADALARAAQTRWDEPRARRVGRVRDLRGVAMVATGASRQPSATVGQMLLLRQMLRLVETLAQIQQAQGRVHRAELLLQAARSGPAHRQQVNSRLGVPGTGSRAPHQATLGEQACGALAPWQPRLDDPGMGR